MQSKMEVYKFIELDNGDVLLEKVVINNEYIVTNVDNGNKILRKITTMNILNESDLKKYDFKKSNIINCEINNEVIHKLKYKSILEHIYGLIGDGSKIIKNSKLNIKTIKKVDEGFYFIEDLGISVQGTESNKCLSEIVNQCIANEINIVMQIKLSNCIIINLNFWNE